MRDNEQSVLTAGWHHSVAWRDVRLNSAFHPGFCDLFHNQIKFPLTSMKKSEIKYLLEDYITHINSCLTQADGQR